MDNIKIVNRKFIKEKSCNVSTYKSEPLSLFSSFHPSFEKGKKRLVVAHTHTNSNNIKNPYRKWIAKFSVSKHAIFSSQSYKI